MAAPDVSVLSAALTAEGQSLSEAYETLRAQAGVSWEWVIQVDSEVLRQPVRLVEDVRVHVQANWGQYGLAITRNRALMRCHGQFVQNLEAGDCLLPGALPALVDALTTHPEAAFAFGWCSPKPPYGEGPQRPCSVPVGMIEPGVLFAAWQTSGLTVLPIHPAGVMWRRQVLLAEGGWPAQASSEHTALLMLAAEKYPAVGVDVGVLTYRTPSAQPGSGLSSQERAQWELIATQVLAARALSSQYGLRRWLHQDPSVSSG